ncbi:response regulator [Burkholderia pseudomallei 1710b]|nr:response regulator [Burkholderia pseudomallei 1710b]
MVSCNAPGLLPESRIAFPCGRTPAMPGRGLDEAHPQAGASGFRPVPASRAARARSVPRIVSRTLPKEARRTVVNARHTTPFTATTAMPLPIVIADDSLLARKLLTKALPADWDVDVNYASNGREALALYRDGKASVMFLDLTMPDMSGYEVLETLRGEDLNTFVIVVSADIQPMAQARVRELGAAAFVAKPVTSEALLPILKEYGLYV